MALLTHLIKFLSFLSLLVLYNPMCTMRPPGPFYEFSLQLLYSFRPQTSASHSSALRSVLEWHASFLKSSSNNSSLPPSPRTVCLSARLFFRPLPLLFLAGEMKRFPNFPFPEPFPLFSSVFSSLQSRLPFLNTVIFRAFFFWLTIFSPRTFIQISWFRFAFRYFRCLKVVCLRHIRILFLPVTRSPSCTFDRVASEFASKCDSEDDPALSRFPSGTLFSRGFYFFSRQPGLGNPNFSINPSI